ncbi:MAG: phage virion morphogenesis protein [Pseudomonadota bacterium]
MIRIDVRDAEAMAYLGQLQDKLNDLTPVMDAIGMRLEEQISMRFETESDPSGQPWAPWAPATRAAYPKDGHGRILDRYGDLLKMSHRADRTSVEVGTGALHGVYHEYGTRHMPRRGFLFADPESGTLGSDDQRAILDLVESYLEG